MTSAPPVPCERHEPIAVNGRYLLAVPAAVAAGRAFAHQQLLALAETDPDHIDDVSVVVSELVTNSITHAASVRNIWLGIDVWPCWTLVTVDDRDPDVHAPDEEAVTDPLPESGRGLLIVEGYAERFWWEHRTLSKTARAVILRSGVELTAADQAVLDRLEKGE